MSGGLTEKEAASVAATLSSEMELALGEKIGEGSYSVVHAAVSCAGLKKAVKVVRPATVKEKYLRDFIPRELELLGRIRHPGVVGMERTLRTDGLILIVGEFLGGGDLLAYVRHAKKLCEDEAGRLMAQLFDAVAFLHAHDIVHRDIKCENVVLDRDGSVAKLCDLGFARIQTDTDADSRTFCGSAAYAAPEILNSLPYRGKPADIWSLGIVLYILVTGFMPFDDRDRPKMLQRQMDHRVHFSRSVVLSHKVKDLILALLHPDPTRRPSAARASRHCWLSAAPTSPPRDVGLLALPPADPTPTKHAHAACDLPLFH